MVGERETKERLTSRGTTRARLVSLIVAVFAAVTLVACDAPATRTLAVEPTHAATSTPVMALPTPNADAASLERVLDAMQVETHWLPDVGVAWETDEPSGKRVTDTDTHCSKFAAAAAMNLGAYILRPPEHPTLMLANAQNDRLNEQGAAQGWTRVANGAQAQALANQGYLVVASYKSPDPQKHGHIAVVRPSAQSAAEIQKEGPQIIQAGIDNFNSASLKEGFKHHSGAFKNNAIEFFAHAVGW